MPILSCPCYCPSTPYGAPTAAASTAASVMTVGIGPVALRPAALDLGDKFDWGPARISQFHYRKRLDRRPADIV
jgi:hypothetical protein